MEQLIFSMCVCVSVCVSVYDYIELYMAIY